MGPKEAAEDLVQEAYVRTYSKWSTVSSGNPYAYVRRVMINRYLDWWRRPWREFSKPDFSHVPSGDRPDEVFWLLSLASMAAATWLTPRLARRLGASPWWGLAVAASPGLLFSATVALTEPLQVALVAAALLV